VRYNYDVYTSAKPGSTPCACTTVKKLSRVLGRAYDAGLTGSGINVTQFAVLRCIARRAGEPLVRVADELEMDRTSLYRALEPMTRDGWVTLNAGGDARSRTARLTKKGTQLIAKAARQWDETQDRLIRRFGKRSYNDLVAELYRLAECVELVDAG